MNFYIIATRVPDFRDNILLDKYDCGSCMRIKLENFTKARLDEMRQQFVVIQFLSLELQKQVFGHSIVVPQIHSFYMEILIKLIIFLSK